MEWMPRPDEPTDGITCPNCGDANTSEADFCVTCGAPVGRFTTLDPMKAIRAEGFTFRKAASARIRPIVLVGMWILFGLPLIGVAYRAIVRTADTHFVTSVGDFFVAVLCVLVLWKVTRNFLVNRPGPGPSDPEGRPG